MNEKPVLDRFGSKFIYQQFEHDGEVDFWEWPVPEDESCWAYSG